MTRDYCIKSRTVFIQILLQKIVGKHLKTVYLEIVLNDFGIISHYNNTV